MSLALRVTFIGVMPTQIKALWITLFQVGGMNEERENEPLGGDIELRSERYWLDGTDLDRARRQARKERHFCLVDRDRSLVN